MVLSLIGYSGKYWLARSTSYLIHRVSSLECFSALVHLLSTLSSCLKEIFAYYKKLPRMLNMGCTYLSLYSISSGYN
jgi:hypothetical protein